MTQKQKISRQMLLYMLLIAAVAFGNGFSDSIYANFFNEAYQVTTQQRAFIEIPREMPGMLCALIIASFSFIGDLRLSIIAQVLAFAGLTALGVFAPSYSVMLIFLFINSLGMHLFMPLSDSIGMSLAEPGNIGRRVGQYASLKTAVALVAGLLVFFGFRFGWFSFAPGVAVKPVFLIGCLFFATAIVLSVMLFRSMRGDIPVKRKFSLSFRWKYRYYYMLTILHGVQKQIAYVFGSWVIIKLLGKGADIMSILGVASSFLGIFFMNLVGRWIDRLGIKKVMYLDALTFIVIYVIYGFVVYAITNKLLPDNVLPVMIVYSLFILDRLSMQIGVVKSVYLKNIAVSGEEVTTALSTGTSLDHIVSILIAQVSGLVWEVWGPHWVFFIAAAFSLGNLVIAWRVKEEKPTQA